MKAVQVQGRCLEQLVFIFREGGDGSTALPAA